VTENEAAGGAPRNRARGFPAARAGGMSGRRPPRALRWAAGLATTAGLAVVAAGCGQAVPNPVGPGGGSSSPSSTPSSSASAVSSSHPPAPLTGLPAASAAGAAKPAVALMVSGSSPQGLGSADVVYEEISSPVRYIAVYQSSQSATVGPITSANPTDREALAVLHALVGYDGSPAPYFIRLLDATKVVDAGYTTHASLYKSTTSGVTTVPQSISGAMRGTAPPAIFQYRGTETGSSTLASTGVSRPGSVTLTIPGLGTQDWSFDASSNRWELKSGGPSVQVANLVIQDVSYKTVNVNPRHGIVVRAASVTGTGRAEVFSGSISGGSGGTAASGTWSKPHTTSLTNYFDSSGSAMTFLPGPTWVIFAPPGTKVGT
jgi:Protein of unknown function (DUF3048) N-terminal domain/Protein of unknown function (DUF3048) C-terminal domain